MERKVTIDDPALDTIVDAVAGLAALVGNLYDTVHRHRHFKNDAENPGGGEWTDLNDAIREADLASVQENLSDIRSSVEALRPGS